MEAAGMAVDAGRMRGGIRLRLIVLLLTVSTGLLADAGDAGSRPLVVSGSNWITDAPTRVADAAGYFNIEADSGPEVRVELAESGKQSLQRLMAGEADFALMAGVPLAMALLRLEAEGAAEARWPRVIASIGLSNSTHHVIADAARGVERPRDLRGLAVGLLRGSSAHYGWDRFADFHRIDPETVRLVDLAPEQLADALAHGRVDAVVTWTPYSERIVDQLGAAGRLFPLAAMDSVSWLLVSTQPMIDGHPDAVRRVLHGYSLAVDLLHSNPARAATLLDQPPGWSRHGRVAWKLTLDWPVLYNVTDKLKWGAGLLDVEPPRLSPARFIAREPMQRYRPAAVTLPVWIREQRVAR